MKDMLPSRNIIAFLLIPTVTFFAVWFAVIQGNKVSEDTTPENRLAATIQSGNATFQEQDSDNDGLKDWEEFLYQTDERNPDTDGDGTFDGAEVNRGYDPLIAGVGTSSIAVSSSTSGFSFYKQDQTLSKTDLLARDIFVAYSELKQADSLGLETIRDDAISKAITESTYVEEQYIFSELDITTTAPSRAAAQRYKQGYAEATNILTTIQFGELDLFYRYIQNNDRSALDALLENKVKYEQFAKELAQVPVPADIAGIHIELLNNVGILAQSIGNMLLIEQDPLIAFVHAKKIVEDEQIILTNTQAIALYFKRNGL